MFKGKRKVTGNATLQRLRNQVALLDELRFEVGGVIAGHYDIDRTDYPKHGTEAEKRIMFKCEKIESEGTSYSHSFCRTVKSTLHCLPDLGLNKKEMGKLCEELNKAVTPVLKPYIDNLKSQICEELKRYKNEICGQIDSEMEVNCGES